jgi:hypothetical protein
MCKYVYHLLHLDPKFHMHSSSGSLVTTIKLKAKEQFCTATMMLFYTPHTKKITLTKVAYSFKIYCYASFQDPKVCGTSTVPILQMCASTTLSLVVGN